MSSGTLVDWSAVGAVFGATMGGGAIDQPADVMGRLHRLGMSPRQQELNHLFAIYRSQQYETCTTEWDGSQKVGLIDREAINTGSYIPPGFYDGGAMLPLRFRNFAVAIIDRETAETAEQTREADRRIRRVSGLLDLARPRQRSRD